MLKNNAEAPYPDGDPDNLVDQFTGTIMKLKLPLLRPERLQLINQILKKAKVHAEERIL